MAKPYTAKQKAPLQYYVINNAVLHLRRMLTRLGVAVGTDDELREQIDLAVGRSRAAASGAKARCYDGKMALIVDVSAGLNTPTTMYAVLFPDRHAGDTYNTVVSFIDEVGRERFIDTGYWTPRNDEDTIDVDADGDPVAIPTAKLAHIPGVIDAMEAIQDRLARTLPPPPKPAAVLPSALAVAQAAPKVVPVETLLITYTTTEGKGPIAEEWGKTEGLERLSALKAGEDAKVNPNSVRVWRQAKTRVKVELDG